MQWLGISSSVLLLTDAGLATLARVLRKLKRVEIFGSKDVTRDGVAALASNASVEVIRVVDCALFKWPDAQRIMTMARRPYLDVKVT